MIGVRKRSQVLSSDRLDARQRRSIKVVGHIFRK
jgi:hypothetical protein